MSIDHLLLPCPSTLLAAECNFLSTALAPLGISESFRIADAVVAFGTAEDKRFFWVSGLDGKTQSPIENVGRGVHIAFKAKDAEQVKQFHKAALEAGGKDNGGPGERRYEKGYYAAFAVSPAGNNVEVVVRGYVG